MIDLGVSGTKYNKAKHRDVRSFFQLLYLFCVTECYECYVFLFDWLKHLPSRVFGMAGVEIHVRIGSCDRALYTAAAYAFVWPQLTIVLCWPHLSRQWTDGETGAKITNSENATLMYEELVHCHNARSPGQHQFLLGVAIQFWSDVRGESAFAKYFKRWYGESHWHNWHVNAVLAAIGATPNQQGIESGHDSIKVVLKKKELRNPTKRFLEFSMKLILIAAGKHAQNMGSASLRGDGPVDDSNLLLAAEEIKDTDTPFLKFTLRDHPSLSLGYFWCHQHMSPNHVTKPCHQTKSPRLVLVSPNHITNPCHPAMLPNHVTKTRLGVTKPCHQTVPPNHITKPSHQTKSPNDATKPSHQTKSPNQVSKPCHQTMPPNQVTITRFVVTEPCRQKAPGAGSSVPSHSRRRGARLPLSRGGGSLPQHGASCSAARALCVWPLAPSLPLPGRSPSRGARGAAACQRRAGAPSAGLVVPPHSRRRDARPPPLCSGGSLSRRCA